MLDGEIGPGGRISDPRDVPGIVLDLAKDVPASVAVSVVRIDEQVEIVGDSIDPSIDPTVFTAAFSGVFRSVRPAAQALQEGPLGTIRDVVVEGERMDLILRPLGANYFLMVLEDRSDPQANLAATRMRMASIAPGVTAILAQQDGEV
jgi:predicted regulator of Ras-like GTPase activity (Roadblock/LC7/MglB family)